jgi:DHA2 family multidrug resistance protein
MALEALQRHGMGQEQALAAINRMIDTQSATLALVEFFWASGVVFLMLIALLWLSSPARRK